MTSFSHREFILITQQITKYQMVNICISWTVLYSGYAVEDVVNSPTSSVKMLVL